MKLYVVIFFLILVVFVCFVNGYVALICFALSLFMISHFFSSEFILLYIVTVFLSFVFSFFFWPFTIQNSWIQSW